jgi:hypothetical protein
MAWPRKNTIGNNVVVWTKRGPQSPKDWENPNKSEEGDNGRDKVVFDFLLILILSILDDCCTQLRSSLKTLRR